MYDVADPRQAARSSVTETLHRSDKLTREKPKLGYLLSAEINGWLGPTSVETVGCWRGDVNFVVSKAPLVWLCTGQRSKKLYEAQSYKCEMVRLYTRNMVRERRRTERGRSGWGRRGARGRNVDCNSSMDLFYTSAILKPERGLMSFWPT